MSTARRRAAYVIVAALLMRTLWAALVPVDPVSDSAMYDTFARRLASGLGYSYPDGSATAYWPVGPSAIYAFFYWTFGSTPIVIACANVAFGTALAWVVYLLTRRMFGGEAALWSGMIIAFWPLLIEFTTVLSSELPSALLIGLALLLWKPTGRPKDNVGFALAVVAASFMRPTALPLLALMPVAALNGHRKWRLALDQLAVIVCVSALVIAPWVVRNVKVTGAPVLISSNFGVNLWMGNNASSNGGYMRVPDQLERLKPEQVRDRVMKEQALRFIIDNPVQYARLCLQRIWMTFSRETIGVAWNERVLPQPLIPWLKIVSTGYWMAMFSAGLLGLYAFVRQGSRNLLEPAVLTPAVLILPAIVVVGQDRYHFALIPFVAIFAGFLFSRRHRDLQTNARATALHPCGSAVPMDV